MATRGTVGILNEDGSVTAIYNHFDSYPDYLGKNLTENYHSEKHVRDLIALGDASIIEPTLEKSVFYGRDRGDDGTEAQTFSSAAEWKRVMKSRWCEYAYLFGNSGWTVTNL